MCGCYELHTQPAVLALARCLKIPPDFTPRDNMAPVQAVLIASLCDEERELSQVCCSCVPFWAKVRYVDEYPDVDATP